MRQLDEFGLRRAARRSLSAGGNIGAALPRLHDQAEKACKRLTARMRGRQHVLWLDNWYWKRYSTDPITTNRSMNTSATAVMGTGERDLHYVLLYVPSMLLFSNLFRHGLDF